MRTAPPSRSERPPLRAPSRLPAARLTHCAMALWIWLGIEPLHLGGGDRGAEDAEHRTGVKAARHDGGDEFGGHALHHLVGGGDRGEELAAGGAGHSAADQRRRQDRDPRMGQHAERVPLAAGEDHFGVDERGAGLGELGAVAQHGRDPAAARLLVLHQRQGLPAGRHVVRDQRRGQRLQRHALGAVRHRRRQVFVAQVGDEPGEIAAEGHGGSALTNCQRIGGCVAASSQASIAETRRVRTRAVQFSIDRSG